MSPSFTRSDLTLAQADAVAERELDLEINAVADTVVRNPFGSITMNLGSTRVNSGLGANLGSTVRNPFGCLKMNLGAARDVLVIAGSKVCA